jgi:mono/diheme cytochrome c family protein
MTTARIALICAGVLAALALAPASAQDLERGRMLHDNHCRMCHDSIAYKRGDKIAKDAAQVNAQVIRWQTNSGLRWTAQDIDNVTAYLVLTYYKYPAPDTGKN